MIYAAISDIRYYILSNKLCLSVLLLYPIFLISLLIQGRFPGLEYLLYSVAIAVGVFIFLLILFARGIMGGGDVKLIPVVALWAGPDLWLIFIFITMLTGGLVALLTISFQYIKNSRTSHKSSENINLSVSHSAELEFKEKHIPYGIGISAGGLYSALKLFQSLN